MKYIFVGNKDEFIYNNGVKSISDLSVKTGLSRPFVSNVLNKRKTIGGTYMLKLTRNKDELKQYFKETEWYYVSSLR